MIEVAGWRKRRRLPRQRAERARKRQRRAWAALAFGLGCALVWHFGHIAGENYTASLADPHFWLHLGIEGIIALYAAAICFIVTGLLQGEL